jgi:PAS domain S-box-containing protein
VYVQAPVRSRECAWRFAKVLVALIGYLLWQPIEVAQAKEVRRVLIFNDFSPLASPGVALLDQAVVTGLQKSPYQIELYSENLESTLFPDPASQREFREWYIRKYSDRKPDVIITVGPASLQFMIGTHEKVFQGIPIVFCGATEEMSNELKPDYHFTGVWGNPQPEETLKLALKLRPTTKQVVVVGGVAAFDRSIEALVKKAFHRYESQLEITYLTDLDMPRLLERLRRLADNSIVFHTSMMEDAAGHHFIDASQAVPMIAGTANAPVFVVDDVDLGRGTVGGYLLSWAADGEDAAKIAVRILDGEKPLDIPVVKNSSIYMFDWRALQRWGLKEKHLPPGSTVLYRQPGVWESFKWYIIGAAALILAEAVLIFALIWNREQRRKSEEYSKQIVLRSPVAMVVARRPEQKVELVNDKFTELFGYTMEDMPDEASWWPLAYPDKAYREAIRAEWRARVEKALRDQAATDPMEASVRCKDGSSRHIEFHFASLGEVSLVSFVDLTDRQRAEVQLRESEQRFRLVANSAPVLIWMAGPDKLYNYFNQACLDFTGQSIGAELGNGWTERVHPDDLGLCFNTYTRAFDRRESFSMQYRLRRYDGEYRWIFDVGVPRFNPDGSFAGYIGSCIDVTDRKVAEESLRNSEERLRLAQKAARIGTFEWNIRTGLNTWTPELEAMYGLPAGGFAQTQAVFENLVHPDDRANVARLVDWALKTGESTEGQWRVIWPDGTVHWIAARWRVLKDESGEPLRMIGVNLDITERKKAEDALASLTGRLIESQEEERRRIARELHDDYNQRLAMMAIDLEKLAGNIEDSSPEARPLVHELFNRVSELGADLHSLSHSLHSSTLENLGLVAGVRAYCREFTEQQGIQVDFAHENVPRGVPADAALCMFRVAQEALRNMKRHSGASRAEVRLEWTGERLHLSVSDRGRGFEANKPSLDGGIGIRSMEERLRVLGGHLEIESQPFAGTRVDAWVPFEIARQHAS